MSVLQFNCCCRTLCSAQQQEIWVEIKKKHCEIIAKMEVYYAGFNGFKQVVHLCSYRVER